MNEDPIVAEVRQIRHQIEQKCGMDSEKYYQHLKTIQKKLVDRLVCRQPNPLPATKQKAG